ncbi:substrate-binding domain-containing protein [Pseudoduganella violaceinigra]|uniref:substrate-binding domain-containing protein n=1 Tax=Pseudoduganella violaceinigra TaxID=246602 RepID=UPI0003FFD6C2|nr:substrate-binding domain-containing protein [Pseudoduganella violaceinigra]
MGFVFAALGLNSTSPGAIAVPPRVRASKLHIAGSCTMGPLLSKIAAKYHLLHPEVAIDAELGGSARGLDDVRAGYAHIAMLSRSLDPSERDLYGIPIARDGVGVAVHANNPLRQLSVEQLRAIFTGHARDWAFAGGEPDSIYALGGARADASSALFARFLRQPLEAFNLNSVVESNIERLAVIAACENAIGYVSVGSVERAISQGVSVRLLPIDGVAASSANIRNGSYPVCRALTLASRDAPTGVARSFFAFCLSAQVNGILSAFDFVPYLD